MERSLGVAELCAEHALFTMELADLDRRIQAVVGACFEGTEDDALTLSAVDSNAEADMLWMELDDIVAQQTATVIALIDKAVGTTEELRDKGKVLAALLRTIRPTENDLAQALSLSLVRDITTLFPQPDFAATNQGAAGP